MKQKLLGTGKTLVYGSAEISISFSSTVIGIMFAIYLVHVIKLPSELAAASVFFGRLIDVVNDPIIGYLSDRMRSPMGRRRPFLLFSALPFGISFALMWVNPGFESHIALAAYYGIAYALYDTFATLTFMPYTALTPELSTDYDQRTALSSSRMFFSILGSLMAVIIPFGFFPEITAQFESNISSFGWIMGFVIMAPILIVFLTIKEPKKEKYENSATILQSLKTVAKNKPFIISMLVYLFTWLTIDIVQTTILFYLNDVLKIPESSDVILGSIFVTAMISVPLWYFLAKRIGKAKTHQLGAIWFALIMAILAFLDSTVSFEIVLTFAILAGFGVGAAHVIPWSIIPDTVEFGAFKTGERNEGMYYSMVTLVQKIASTVAIPGVLLLLGASGFMEGSKDQPQSAIEMLRFITGPLSGILLSISIIISIFYPITRKKYNQLKRILDYKESSLKSNEETLETNNAETIPS